MPARLQTPVPSVGPVAVVGGTGRLGMALARRLSQAEVPVIIGSRDPAKAKSAAASLGATAQGFSNADAAAAARVIVLSVPYAAHRVIVESLAAGAAGKVVIDTAVPFVSGEVPHVDVPPAGSLALETAALLPEAKVAASFHTVSAVMLSDLERPPHGDVLICADDMDAKRIAEELVRAIGMRPVDAGGLAQAHALEQLAGLLRVVNRRYRRRDLGVTIAGLE